MPGHSVSFRDAVLLGVVFMLLASALIAATTLFAKALGLAGMHSLQVSAGRFLFGFLTLAVFVAIRSDLRPSLAGTPWGLHATRSAFGWLGVSCMFAAVALMPLAEATAISFLNPIVTILLACLLLKESFGLRKTVATLLSLVGAMVIIQPGTEAFQLAALVALAAAFFMGAEGMLIKKLSGTEPPLRILLVNNGIGAVIALTAAASVWQWPTPEQWLLMAGLGAVMVTAQACFIQSMKRAPATVVMPAFYSILAFSAVYDVLFFAIWPTATTILGGVLIVVGALFVVFSKPR